MTAGLCFAASRTTRSSGGRKYYITRNRPVHVVEPSYMPASEMGGIVEVESVDDAKKKLQGLRDRLAGKVRCQTLLREGSAQHEIIAVAKELGSDLIILSTHGRTGLDRIVMGSTAERVVRHAGCPTLIVRKNEHEFVTGSEINLPPEAKAETRASR